MIVNSLPRRTGTLSFYRTWHPDPQPISALVSAVCRRWRVEEDFQGAKGLAHLDTGQVTCWTSWHRWSLMSMIAYALLAVGALQERQRVCPGGELAMVPVSPRELLALFRVFALPRPRQDTDPAHALHWSNWRRCTFTQASHTSRLEMSNGLADAFNSSIPLLPENFRLTTQTSHARPDPFAPPRLPGLHRYYEPVRRRAAQRYSAPGAERFRTGLSLSPRPLSQGSIATRLPTFRTEAADRARAAFMPDTAWPINGHPPGLSRDPVDTPVLMSSTTFDMSSAVHSRSPSRSPPDG